MAAVRKNSRHKNAAKSHSFSTFCTHRALSLWDLSSNNLRAVRLQWRRQPILLVPMPVALVLHSSFSCRAPLVFHNRRFSKLNLFFLYLLASVWCNDVGIKHSDEMYLNVDKVSVVFDEAYDRIPHPDTNLENSISEVTLNFLNSHLFTYLF
jgi:hypothetical protein